jgi:hypothetical protein
MKLTPEEIKNIDNALEALKRSLKVELQRGEGQQGHNELDDAFLKKIADSYLSAGGILCLLQDMNMQGKRCGGPCYVTCVNPNKVACWNAGTVL